MPRKDTQVLRGAWLRVSGQRPLTWARHLALLSEPTAGMAALDRGTCVNESWTWGPWIVGLCSVFVDS